MGDVMDSCRADTDGKRRRKSSVLRTKAEFSTFCRLSSHFLASAASCIGFVKYLVFRLGTGAFRVGGLAGLAPLSTTVDDVCSETLPMMFVLASIPPFSSFGPFLLWLLPWPGWKSY